MVILLIGAALALSQFDKLERLATGLLASSAVLGLVLGLAARQVLANPIAGILLAITQPIRIGDSIEIGDEAGRVNDITLAYTYIDTARRPPDGRPERDRASPASSSTAPPATAARRPRRRSGSPATPTSRKRPGGARPRSRSARSTSPRSPHEGVRIDVHGASDPTRTVMEGEEAALRERSHEALREAGVLQA